MKNFIPTSARNIPRQSLPQYYFIHGGIFLAKTNAYLTSQNVYEMNTFAYVMPKERSVDIDSIEDFYLAELLYKNATTHIK